MNLLITFLGNLLALCGAIIALTGNTWDREKRGLKRLTLVGKFAAVVAIVGMGISTYQAIDRYRTERVYRENAMADIYGGWRQVATPWALALWEVTDKKNKLAVSTLEEIRDGDFLQKFDEIDLGILSRVPEYGEMTLGNLFCRQSGQGMRIMGATVQGNTTFLPRDVAAGVKELRRKPMWGRLLKAGCSDLQRDTPDYTLLKGKFNSDEGKSYLAKLIELGKLLER